MHVTAQKMNIDKQDYGRWIEEDARSSSPNRLQGATLAFTWRTEENHANSKTADLRELDLGSEYEVEIFLKRWHNAAHRG